uniref:Uncharacterized protein n=1 Tax=candidate division WOR-3 bacterium TaxID=2052148 RepID=A0A7C4X8X1_UNCW3
MRKWLLIFLSASLLFARTQIWIELDSNVEFDLSLVLYPPLIYPTYYFPTLASPLNPQGIRLRLGYRRRPPGGHTVSTLYLATRGSGNFSSSIDLDQLFFAPDGEPLPPPGVDPPGGNWRSYSITYQQIEQFPVVGIAQIFIRPQDFIFQTEPDDEPGNFTITIYYRLYGL